MIFAVAFHSGDKDQAARLLAWIKELGGYERHRFFVMPAKGQRADFPDAPPFEVVGDYEGRVSDWSAPGSVRDASGPNSTIRQFAWFFYQKGFGPWMFLEPDCIPLCPEWADKIEAEYKRAGKAFMGSLVPGKPGEYDAHSTGNMVLPQDVAALAPNLMLPRYATISGKQVEIAFDVAGASDVLANYHDTPLLHHVFRGPEFETAADLARIRPGAVLFHTAKGPGLVRLLREQRFGARHGAPRDAATLPVAVVETAGPAISETPRTKVFTYFSPVTSVEGLAEQHRLIELWRSSWRKHGWEPVVLMEEDAARHPRFAEWKAKFEKLPTINPKVYEMAAWTRHIAMANHGGLLTDYDCVNLGLPLGDELATEFKRSGHFPALFCKGVPCAISGSATQFENAIVSFIMCEPVIENGKLHLSDMHAAQKLDFHSVDICREYGTPDWREAKLIHFGHYSCAPNKRSDTIAHWLEHPLPEESATAHLQTNGTHPETIVGLIRDGVGILSQLATNGSRKKRILNELRKAGLVGQAKKRARRRLATA